MFPGVLSDRVAAQAKQVAGRLCLDFANLVGGWRSADDARDDRLSDYGDLLAWSWRAERLEAAAAARLWQEAQGRAREAAAVLARARRLRDAIHAVAWSLERGSAPRRGDLEAIAGEARRAREHQTLEAAGGRLAWRLTPDRKALETPLWPIALSAEDYFTTADLSRLHSCPGEDCGWHFEDTSRNRSRQWCDMGDCGNTAKVRRFRSRQRGGRARG